MKHTGRGDVASGAPASAGRCAGIFMLMHGAPIDTDLDDLSREQRVAEVGRLRDETGSQ